MLIVSLTRSLQNSKSMYSLLKYNCRRNISQEDVCSKFIRECNGFLASVNSITEVFLRVYYVSRD